MLFLLKIDELAAVPFLLAEMQWCSIGKREVLNWSYIEDTCSQQ